MYNMNTNLYIIYTEMFVCKVSSGLHIKILLIVNEGPLQQSTCMGALNLEKLYSDCADTPSHRLTESQKVAQ